MSVSSFLYSEKELLAMAIHAHDIEFVNLLLDQVSDVNIPFNVDLKPPRSAFSVENIRCNMHEMVHYCSTMKSTCNSFCRATLLPVVPSTPVNRRAYRSVTAMHAAAAADKVQFIQALIEHGGNVDAQMDDEFTPLMVAVVRKNYESAKVLLKFGADVNAKSIYSTSSLYLAVKTGELKTVRLLLNSGANVNTRNRNRATPLHQACLRKFDDIAELLLSFGADPTVKTRTGVSPLHCAAANGDVDLVKTLLNHGANSFDIYKFGIVDVYPMVFVNDRCRSRIFHLMEDLERLERPPITRMSAAKRFAKKIFGRLICGRNNLIEES